LSRCSSQLSMRENGIEHAKPPAIREWICRYGRATLSMAMIENRMTPDSAVNLPFGAAADPGCGKEMRKITRRNGATSATGCSL